MNKVRVIPVLLLQGESLVKTKKFKLPAYIGDPLNAVRIFNEKEVDELVLLDIEASKSAKEPDYDILREIASQAFMPMSYGGGITNIQQIQKILSIGFEKVIINSAAYEHPDLVLEASSLAGSQSIVGCIDVQKSIFGYRLYSKSASRKQSVSLSQHIKNLVSFGVGEIIINSIDRDGMMTGYDITLLQQVSEMVSLPIVACGGAGKIDDLREVIDKTKVSAVAAGSLFVFTGKHQAVLINYPDIENFYVE